MAVLFFRVALCRAGRTELCKNICEVQTNGRRNKSVIFSFIDDNKPLGSPKERDNEDSRINCCVGRLSHSFIVGSCQRHHSGGNWIDG